MILYRRRVDRETGEVSEHVLPHDGETVRASYQALPAPVVVGIEGTESMGWFVRLMEELGITCRVGHLATIRTAEPRRQKHDRRDAPLIGTCEFGTLYEQHVDGSTRGL